MKSIIFPTKQEAEQWNNEVAISKGCNGVTAFWFPMQELTETTTLTKTEYAELYDIPATLTNEEGEEIANTEYTSIPKTISVPKYACVVGDELDKVDEETGEVIVPEEVVDISSLIVTSEEE